jgi:hypothetical protein
VDWDEAGFSKLRFADKEDATLKIHIRASKSQSFARAENRGGEKADERCIGVCAQSAGRRQSRGFGHQPLQFVVGVDVRRIAPPPSANEPRRRNLSARISRTEPHGEPPHDAQAPSPSGALRVFRLHGPAKRQFRGDELCPLVFQKTYEVVESHGRLSKFCAERPPHGKVLRQCLGYGAHWPPPITGHGRATVRNASKDTWA